MLRIIAISLALIGFGAAPVAAEPSHGIAMRGEPLLPANFKHLPYANPNAPKGGKLTYGVFGTFDDLNPFDLQSIRTGARGLWDPVFGNLVFEPLMKRSRDEPFTLYGLIAEKVSMAPDRSSIEFFLNPKARFSDGESLDADDVIFTFELLGEKGRPPFSSRMKQVDRMEKTGSHSVKLTFNDLASRETPLLFALMPVLPEHATDKEAFGRTTIEPPIGSGPYLVADVQPGDRIIYEKNSDYWGADLPVNRGFHNFETIQVDYFRSSTSQFEAFKKGLFDIYPENSPAKWRTAYDFPAVDDGRVKKASFINQTPSGMLGFVFNTRQPLFANRNVRKALGMIFDFEWANENLFFGSYVRTNSYWQNSYLSWIDNPINEIEAELFGDDIETIPADIQNGSYRAPVTDGTGRDRKILRNALTLLREEGFRLENGLLVSSNGEPLSFEMLIAGDAGISGQDIERLALSYKQTAARLGITIDIRLVDDAQYQARKGSFDFDMTIARYSSSLSPGAEQTYRWGSASRDLEGSFNFAGTEDPLLDRLIDAILAAQDEAEFTAAVRAFDRSLVAGHYVVPLYHLPEQRIAYWVERIGSPESTPLYGPQFETWWSRAVQ